MLAVKPKLLECEATGYTRSQAVFAGRPVPFLADGLQSGEITETRVESSTWFFRFDWNDAPVVTHHIVSNEPVQEPSLQRSACALTQGKRWQEIVPLLAGGNSARLLFATSSGHASCCTQVRESSSRTGDDHEVDNGRNQRNFHHR
ncbi:hypothetical protein [Paraburkholderia sp. UCT2]|uniref:hypothetical protein n=1 Tax=Paraburkholderia sp. UCT2 TaxID=2615208 RepID=UPI001654D74F|nr:hypothetical protein [Paraburkholderia sp. UCT2]MBC8729727.1 hypothetical protein [Paraburkholderia sp. UCT2]